MHKLLVAVAAFTFASTFAFIGPAGADSNQSIYNGGIERARSNWISDGASGIEILGVKDSYADGWGAKSQWSGAGQSGTCPNELGAGTTNPCYLELPENRSVFYNVCSKDGATTLACTPGIPDHS